MVKRLSDKLLADFTERFNQAFGMELAQFRESKSHSIVIHTAGETHDKVVQNLKLMGLQGGNSGDYIATDSAMVVIPERAIETFRLKLNEYVELQKVEGVDESPRGKGDQVAVAAAVDVGDSGGTPAPVGSFTAAEQERRESEAKKGSLEEGGVKAEDLLNNDGLGEGSWVVVAISGAEDQGQSK